MDQICFVSSSDEGYYYVHALDVSAATKNLNGPAHPLPNPVLKLPIAGVFPTSGVFQEGYPLGMSFGPLGSKLFMIGGYIFQEDRPLEDEPPKLSLNPSVDVYVVDMLRQPTPSVIKGPPLNYHKGDSPIVIPLGKKLYVFPKSFGRNGEAFIECFDTQEPDSSWALITVPPELSALADMPFKVRERGCVVTTHRREFMDYDAFVIEAYGTRGPEILLCLTLCKSLRCGDLIYNTETEQWLMPDLQRTSELVYTSCLFSGSVCCAANTITSQIHLTDLHSEEVSVIEIPTLVSIDENRLVKQDENRLLAFSWVWIINGMKRWVDTYFRVDKLVISNQKKRLGNIVSAISFENQNHCLKLQQVHYCYIPHGYDGEN